MTNMSHIVQDAYWCLVYREPLWPQPASTVNHKTIHTPPRMSNISIWTIDFLGLEVIWAKRLNQSPDLWHRDLSRNGWNTSKDMEDTGQDSTTVKQMLCFSTH